MAAEVSSLLRVMIGYKEEYHRTMGNESNSEKSTALITRDLLGGSSSKFTESQELDLDSEVPSGWEKRLDLKSGKIYIQRCCPPNPTSITDSDPRANSTETKLTDLNFLPSPTLKLESNHFEETSLDLKLVSSSQSSTSNYQSVCTLDKVKYALQRVEKEPLKKRSMVWKPSSPPSYSSSSSFSIKEFQEENENNLLSSPVAAGCPGCLSYVLTMKDNPRCPRCNSVVQLPVMKKPRIDLNISI